MPLSAGAKLGPYEIVEPIGAGGMGEVYRARDPRMGREVAIKISADGFSERFDREVRAVAALNHPNICQIYDVGPNYLVMELVEGDAPRGPLGFETAMNYARQIGAALAAAHEKGIVHRDLKPANIRVRADGTVKVLDFGLAKCAETAIELLARPRGSARRCAFRPARDPTGSRRIAADRRRRRAAAALARGIGRAKPFLSSRQIGVQ